LKSENVVAFLARRRYGNLNAAFAGLLPHKKYDVLWSKTEGKTWLKR
jgi:hypothetical protein